MYTFLLHKSILTGWGISVGKRGGNKNKTAQEIPWQNIRIQN